MPRTSLFAMARAATSIAALTPLAWAGDQYAFPSTSGPLIAASAPAAFVAAPGSTDVQAKLSFSAPSPALTTGADFTLMPAPFGSASHGERNAEANGYRFLMEALGYSAFANYANDYYRLFAPGHAVSAWTDRVSGYGGSYGGAIDGWTVAAYYMPKLGGPRRDSAPDLSLMPTLRAHPELQQVPTFTTK